MRKVLPNGRTPPWAAMPLSEAAIAMLTDAPVDVPARLRRGVAAPALDLGAGALRQVGGAADEVGEPRGESVQHFRRSLSGRELAIGRGEHRQASRPTPPEVPRSARRRAPPRRRRGWSGSGRPARATPDGPHSLARGSAPAIRRFRRHVKRRLRPAQDRLGAARPLPCRAARRAPRRCRPWWGRDRRSGS